MGIVNSCNRSEKDFIDKINSRRTRGTITHSTLSRKSIQPIKKALIRTLSCSFQKDQHSSPEYKELKTVLFEVQNKEIISTFSFIQWDRDFIDLVRSEENPLFLMELESSRFSQNFLSKIKKNLFWRIVKTYDKSITRQYGGEMRRIFVMTYKNSSKQVDFSIFCHNLTSQQKLNFEEMLRKMVNVKDTEIRPIEDKIELKRVKSLLKTLLKSVKALSTFFAKVLYDMYSEGIEEQNRQTEDFFAMCILMNSLLRSKFVYYCFIFYLSRISIFKNKQTWLSKRQILKRDLAAFDDLIYMKEFLLEEESQCKLRSHSIQFLRTSSTSRNIEQMEKMTPEGMHRLLKSSLFLDTEEAKKSNQNSYLKSSTLGSKHVQMDMGEFLVHLNLHMKMNLDYVFKSDLKEILKFFTNIEDFMEKTFGNKELEIKIDMMRLIVRMTNATYFIDKIYMLSQMNIKFLDYWQTFSLFTQVLMSELLTANQPPKTEHRVKKKTIYDSTLESIIEHDNQPELSVSNFTDHSQLVNKDQNKRKKGLFGMNLEDTVTRLEEDSDDDEPLNFKVQPELTIKGDGSVDKRIERGRVGIINEDIMGESLQNTDD